VLWRDSPASFASRARVVREDLVRAAAVQPGGIPVWFSGTLHKRNLERIVRWGDGWIPIMTATRATRRRREAARRAFAKAGRDPRALKVRGSLETKMGANGRPDLAATLAGAHELAAAGATDVQLGLLAFVRKPEQQDAFFAELRSAGPVRARDEGPRDGRHRVQRARARARARAHGPRRVGVQPRQDRGRPAAHGAAPDRRPHRPRAAARAPRGPRLGLRIRHQRLSPRGRDAA
jgi:alkanesulfonate monooxygenase SsuD/methylene tetrahydromethanopterin reductase-like flavin-dependent oxidoreductase (luciferase family)